MKTLTINLLLWSAGALLLVSPIQLPASTLLIDRGLPTTNLNNEAGVDRSNTCWVVPRNKAYDTNYDLVGDTITNTTSTDYHIDTIRIWTVGPIDAAYLWGGLHGGPIGLIGAPSSMTVVHYVGGLNYGVNNQQLTQLDFSVSLVLKAGQTFDFFFDGTRVTWPFAPFVHASNAALSGSPQQGADNLMLFVDFKHGTLSRVRTWDSSDKRYWNKSTDVNVQVFGTVLPPAATLSSLAPRPNAGVVAVAHWRPAPEGLVWFGSARIHDSLVSAVPGNTTVSGLFIRSRWAERRRGFSFRGL